MIVNWVPETPTEEGWYWMKYSGKENRTIVCPAEVTIFKKNDVSALEATHVRSARNDAWIEGPNHGGPGLKYHGKLDKSVRFGPKIECPDN